MMTSPTERDYTDEEIRSILKNGLGDSIVISGGEPLLYKDDVIKLLKIADELGLSSMINTNGSLPIELNEILELGLLSAISIDVKGPFNEDYFDRFGINTSNVKRSISLVQLYNIPFEARLTVCKDVPGYSEDDILRVAAYMQGVSCKFIIQQFISSDGVLDKTLTKNNQPTHDDLEAVAKIAALHLKMVYIRSDKGLERIK